MGGRASPGANLGREGLSTSRAGCRGPGERIGPPGSVENDLLFCAESWRCHARCLGEKKGLDCAVGIQGLNRVP